MAAKFDKTTLEKKYRDYVERAYNLQFGAPAESDYYAHEAKKVLMQLLLLTPNNQNQLIRAIA